MQPRAVATRSSEELAGTGASSPAAVVRGGFAPRGAWCWVLAVPHVPSGLCSVFQSPLPDSVAGALQRAKVGARLWNSHSVTLVAFNCITWATGSWTQGWKLAVPILKSRGSGQPGEACSVSPAQRLGRLEEDLVCGRTHPSHLSERKPLPSPESRRVLARSPAT